MAVHGLENGSEDNGKFGNVLAWDDDKGRYHVQLEAGGRTLALRPGNVTQQCNA